MDTSLLNKHIEDRDLLIQEWVKKLTIEWVPHVGRSLYACVCKNQWSNFAAACVELKINPDLWKWLLDNEFFLKVVDIIESTGKIDFWKIKNSLTSWLTDNTKENISQVFTSRKKSIPVNPAQFISYPVKSDEEIKKLSIDLLSNWVKLTNKIIARFGITPYLFWEILRWDKVFATKLRKVFKEWLTKRWSIDKNEINKTIDWLKKPQSWDNFWPQKLPENPSPKVKKSKLEKKTKVQKQKPEKKIISKKPKPESKISVKKVVEKKIKIPAKFTYKNTEDSYFQLKNEMIRMLIDNNWSIWKLSNKKWHDRVYVLMNQDKQFADIMNWIIKSRRWK